ncbi:hypothetical protein KIL84_001450 [Mauremys mutica]|uniref:Uncharacterized protein n=1 Tax=Mauremys mutica TaxID=74926 RepID=A0A9D3X0S1_9SAUR|nr:hypothetical protein KIL84_001450 [Mauremys mutica]
MKPLSRKLLSLSLLPCDPPEWTQGCRPPVLTNMGRDRNSIKDSDPRNNLSLEEETCCMMSQEQNKDADYRKEVAEEPHGKQGTDHSRSCRTKCRADCDGQTLLPDSGFCRICSVTTETRYGTCSQMTEQGGGLVASSGS